MQLTRRGVLLGAGAAIVLAGCGGRDSSAGSSSTSSPASNSPGSTVGTQPVACMLTPELTAGPYHLDDHLVRADITEGRPGTPLELRVRVLALPDCAPLQGAAVDVWHCDAGGEYSGFNGNSLGATQAEGTNDRRFLRGVQVTDADGVATFTTIFPGWYEGRSVHIHLEVLDGGTVGAIYTGGHVAHVGQAFFDEAITAELLEAEPYLAHTGSRTRNEDDSIYAQAGPGAITALAPRSPGDPTAGYVGEFTCMVDPDATPAPAPLF